MRAFNPSNGSGRFSKAIAKIAHAVARAITQSVHRLASLCSRLVADLRPSAMSASTPSASTPSARRDAAHVYLVRRIVVFGGAALVVLAIVLGIVFGVRALSGAGDDGSAPAASQSGSAAADQQAGTADGKSVDGDQSGKSSDSPAGDQNTADDGQDAAADAADPANAQNPAPLTDEDRADILAKAHQTATESGNELVEYTYCIASKGDVGDLTDFSNTVFSALNDPRGWPRAGAVFQENTTAAQNEAADAADPNACSMTLILAAADQMTSFSEGCSDEYSCRVGNDVIINIDRWNNATEDWLNAGGTVDRYRTMVINHEVGHRLGHLDNELTCPAVNQPAPLMQQQSMDLLGCVPNEWPLDDELWVSE